MAHHVYYYVPSATDPHARIREVRRSLEQAGRDVVDQVEGATWVEVEVRSPSGAYTSVEVHGDTPETWSDLIPGGPGPDPSEVHGLVIMTLSGPGFDERVIARLRALFVDEWAAVEYDEIGGFTSRRSAP